MNAALACEILELPLVFDEKELKRTYRRLMMQWHPDRQHGDAAQIAGAVAKAQELNAAYEFLTEVLEAGWKPNAAAASRPRYETRHTYRGERYASGFPDSSVTEVFLKSSHIVSTGYDQKSKTLYIKFTGQRVYRYFAVPEAVVTAFIQAESHGKFAQRHIYHAFRFEPC